MILGWDPPLGSGVQKAQTHREWWVWHIQGAKLGVRDKPGPEEATTTLRVCLSWCPVLPVSCPSWNPVHPATPWLYRASVGCCAGLPPHHHFSFQSWMRAAGPGAAFQSPHPCASWVGRSPPCLCPSSCPSSPCTGWEAQPEPLPTALCITPPRIPVFLWNRWLRHSNNTLAKPILQELESPAASNTKATHSTAIIWEILTYFPLPAPTLQTHTLRPRRLDFFFCLNIRFNYHGTKDSTTKSLRCICTLKDSNNNLSSANFIFIRNVLSCNTRFMKTNVVGRRWEYSRSSCSGI